MLNKFIIAPVLIILFNITAFSQVIVKPGTKDGSGPYIQQRSKLLAHTAAKTTSNQYRLIAMAADQVQAGSFVFQDSIVFTYSNGRGGAHLEYLSPDYPLFDSIITYDATNTFHGLGLRTYDGSNHLLSDLMMQQQGTWDSVQMSVNTYDANNDLVMNIMKLPYAGALRDEGRAISTYDSHHNIISQAGARWHFSTNTWLTTDSGFNTYDANNNNLTRLHMVFDTVNNVWMNSYRGFSTYDANNNILRDSSQTWNSGTNSWDNSFVTNNIYDANNKMISNVQKVWTGSAWQNTDRTIWNYDPNTDLKSIYMQTWQQSSNSWYTYARDTCLAHDSFHNCLVSIEQNWDSTTNTFVNGSIDSITYNADNLMTSSKTLSWVSNSWQIVNNDSYVRLYYELYTPSKIDENLNNTENRLSVYPVPAQNLLNIDLSWNAQEPATISLYDVSGKLWRQWNVGARTHTLYSASVAQLPAGNYFVNVKGDKKQLTRTITVVH